MSWLLLVVVIGCFGSDGNPVKVAERFQARLLDRDDLGAHELLTDADRLAVPFGAFPQALPDPVALRLFALGESELESASLLSEERDTAAVVLRLAGRGADTVRLVATHDPIGIASFHFDRVRWRVSMGLAERALLDSLAAAMRTNAAAPELGGLEQANAYIRAAERHPGLARPADLAAARSLVRSAAVAEALSIQLRVMESFTGTIVIDGRIENPSRNRIATLRLIVQDEAGAEERVEVWDIEPGGTRPVRQVTRLSVGPVTHRVARIDVF